MVVASHGTNEVLFYEIAVTGDTIYAATWSIEPTATLSNQSLFSETGLTGAKVLVGPLTEAHYVLTGHLTGTSLQQYEENIKIKVAPR